MVDSRSLERALWSAMDSLRGTLTTAESVRVIVTLYGMKVLNDGTEVYERLPHRFFSKLGWYGVRSSQSPAAYLAEHLAYLGESTTLRFLSNKEMTGLFQKLGDERLSRLTLTLDKLDVCPASRSDLLKLGDVLTQLFARFAATDKYFGESLTPVELSVLKAKLILPNMQPVSQEIYDPVCGVGGNLVQAYRELPDKDREKAVFFGQDTNLTSLYLCTWNLLLHGITTFELVAGDTLSQPGFSEEGKGKELKRFDAVLADPPLSMKFRDDFGVHDPFRRFRYGEVRGSRADYAFLQHILASLKINGKAAVIVALGALFRSGFEQEIRENFVRAGVVSASIGLPSNLLSYTGLPVNMLLFDVLQASQSRESVQFVDASEMVSKTATRGRASTIGADTLGRIIATVRERKVEQGFSAVVGIAELDKHDYSLLPQVYITKPLPKLPSVEQLGDEIKALEQGLAQERETFDGSIEAMLKSLDKDAN